MSISKQRSANTLWTKNFTIITVGSVVSMLGSTLAGFAMSLLVLDYTGSTFLFALYNVFYMLPYSLAPVLCGPFLDRFSRRKTIYTLDFITAGYYGLLSVILTFGKLNFVFIAVSTLIIGTIGSIYTVAYESFYPLLISEGNYSKAYSVQSTLEVMTFFMTPVSAFVYNKFGIVPLFVCNVITYLIAAITETQIKADENYIEKHKEESSDSNKKLGFSFIADFKEGMKYLISEKGLLAVAVYFCFSSLSGGATGTLELPFFKNTYENGEYYYMLVVGTACVGRAIGGALHYKFKLPHKKKFEIALIVYITISLLEGFFLFFPIPVMMVMCFLTGIGGVTSYNIRISATQQYVPDEKKGRFNGTFGTLNTIGTLLGQLVSGALGEFLPARGILCAIMMLNVLAAVVIIGGNKKHVAKIYNVPD